MRTRQELPQIDESMFEIVENRKLAMVVGGGATGNTQTFTAKKTGNGTGTVKDDGSDSYAGE